MRSIAPLILLFTLIAAPTLANDNWPDFRGPELNGTSDTANVPTEWSESHNVAWKTAIHGLGWSTPAIMGNQIWLTTATEDGTEMSVLCIDRESGNVLLDRVIFTNESPRPLGNDLNTYASPSPVIEQGRVYVHFGSYGTAAIDTTNFEELWRRRDLECNHWRGPASSPVLHNDLIILTFDGADFQYTAALDKNTGKTRWLTGRTADFDDLTPEGFATAGGDWRKAYNTPVMLQVNGQTQMISPGAKAINGYNPTTGRELWTLPTDGHSSASRTVIHNGLAIVNSGYGRTPITAFRPPAPEPGQPPVTVTEDHIAWTYSRNKPSRPSPVIVDGLFYMISDTGIATCIDAATGEDVWRERVGGEYSSSMLHAGGHIYYLSHEGKATVIKPGRTYNPVSENHLNEGFMASPAVAGDALFLRTRTHLYRIEAD